MTRGLFQMRPASWPDATPPAPAHGWVPDERETEMNETTYTREDMARAWDEGAEYAWNRTGEGLNGEYALGYGTHDGTVSFRTVMGGTTNPYEQEEA